MKVAQCLYDKNGTLITPDVIIDHTGHDTHEKYFEPGFWYHHRRAFDTYNQARLHWYHMMRLINRQHHGFIFANHIIVQKHKTPWWCKDRDVYIVDTFFVLEDSSHTPFLLRGDRPIDQRSANATVDSYLRSHVAQGYNTTEFPHFKDDSSDRPIRGSYVAA